MNENKKVIETVEIEEGKFHCAKDKFGAFLNKHGKKIAVGAAVVIGVVVACAIKKGGADNIPVIDLTDSDTFEDNLETFIDLTTKE